MITVNINCKYCGSLVRNEKRNKIGVINKEKYSAVCDSCKIKNRIKISERMKINNPAFKNNPNGKKLPEKIKISKEQLSEIHRKRMKESNPMKNPDIVEKMKNTIRERIKSGEIKYKIGKDNPRYKGRRPLDDYIRTSLQNWRKNLIFKTNFTCEICGKHDKGLLFNVHHTEPLSSIISNFLSELGLEENTKIDEISNDNLIKLRDNILKYHNENNIGIVVCEDCHSEIDNRFHKKKEK